MTGTSVGDQQTRLERVGAAYSEVGVEQRLVPPEVRRHRFLITVGQHAGLIAVATIFLAPFFFIVMTALMTDQQAVTPSFIPNPFVWGNFAEVFDRIPFFTYVWNTTQIAVLSTVGIILSCVPVAYALARMRWKGRQVAFLLVLSTLMLPVQVTIVPLYILWVRVGQIGHMTPLDPAELPRRRVLDLPAPSVLPDDPRGVVRRGSGRRRERVPDHDARDRSPGQAGDRRGGVVQLPLQLERSVLAPAVLRAEPEAVDADDRSHGVPTAARHRVEPDDGGIAHVHAARHHPVLPGPARVRRRCDAHRRQGVSLQ